MDLPDIGRYTIISELGRGAMGVVYKARDPMLDRTVAIKTINMALEGSDAAQYEARFQQEARAAGGLNHPNIVTIHDIGKSGEIAYMAMEFIDGVELRSMLAAGRPLPTAQAVSIAAQIADGLAYAHERGVVHRDIKPPNIMVLRNGLAKITDFGIARMRSSAVQTQTGTMMGSPKYMSPEQVLGQRADHRSDIFSLGIILYEMLAGTVPFAGESITAIMYKIVNTAPPAPSKVKLEVPEMLDAIVAKMLVKRMDERYQSADELARDLRACARALASAIAAPVPAQPVVQIPGLDSGTLPEPQTPVRGLARAFDSNEATMRLAALTDRAPGAASIIDLSASTLLRPAWRNWSWRDAAVLALAALAGLAAAALILGA